MKIQWWQWRFWLLWVAASNIGFLAGTVIGVLPFILFQLSQQTALFQAVTGGFVGGGIALGQWLILRRQISLSPYWILAGLVGLGIANVIGAAFCLCFAGFVYPVIAAGWQAFILRNYLLRAWLWLPAGLAGAVLGGAINEIYHGANWTTFAYVTASSTVTGFALLWLMKNKQ